MIADIFSIQDKNALLGIALAAIAGFLVRHLDKILRTRTDYFTEAQTIREEQRGQINVLTEENERLRKEMDEWREKYWAEVQTTAELNARILALEQLHQLTLLPESPEDERLRRSQAPTVVMPRLPEEEK